MLQIEGRIHFPEIPDGYQMGEILELSLVPGVGICAAVSLIPLEVAMSFEPQSAWDKLPEINQYIETAEYSFKQMPDGPWKNYAEKINGALFALVGYMNGTAELRDQVTEERHTGILQATEDFAWILANSLVMHPDDPDITTGGEVPEV